MNNDAPMHDLAAARIPFEADTSKLEAALDAVLSAAEARAKALLESVTAPRSEAPPMETASTVDAALDQVFTKYEARAKALADSLDKPAASQDAVPEPRPAPEAAQPAVSPAPQENTSEVLREIRDSLTALELLVAGIEEAVQGVNKL